jgi:hypothetical protein
MSRLRGTLQVKDGMVPCSRIYAIGPQLVRFGTTCVCWHPSGVQGWKHSLLLATNSHTKPLECGQLDESLERELLLFSNCSLNPTNKKASRFTVMLFTLAI